MQFSTDQRHAATLDFLAEVRDYIASWPAHPMNREMIQRIEAHLAEPAHHLVRQGSYSRSGATFTSAGLCILKAVVQGNTVTVGLPSKSEHMPEDHLLHKLRRGVSINVTPDESITMTKKFTSSVGPPAP